MALSDVLGLLAGSFGAGLSEYGAEQQRQQELARKRAEEERIRQATQALFRGGDVTPELAGAAITAGVSPTVVGSAQMFGRRQEEPREPVLTVQPYLGGKARMKDGVFDVWVTRPPSERETGVTPAEIRSAQTELRGAESGFRSTMARRPRPAQFPGEMGIGTDTSAFNRSLQDWRADSTYAAQRREQAAKDVEELTGKSPLGLTSQPAATQSGLVPNAALQNAIVMEAQRKIAEIMALQISDVEKANAVQRVNDRLRTFLGTLNR
jgi:hypothetical protein